MIKLNSQEQEALHHAEELKKFCKRGGIIKCVRCAFKKVDGAGCLFYGTIPCDWDLPQQNKC